MRHMKNHHSSDTYKQNTNASHHVNMVPQNPQEGKGTRQEESKDVAINDCITSEEAIAGNLKKITISAEDQTKYDPMAFLKSKEEQIRVLLREELKKRLRIKFYITLQVRFNKIKGDQVQTTDPFFHGRCHVVLKKEDIEFSLRESMKKIFTSFLEYQREGSNWALDKVLGVNLHIVKYKPFKGSSYIPLPAKLANKRAIVNVQNTDQKCFMWSVLAALHQPPKNAQRVTKYEKYQDELDFTDIPFPVRVSDVPKFEKKNGLSVNVFGYEKSEVYPIHLTKERGVRHVDLLVISKDEKSHYCWIKNFNGLLFDQNNHKEQYHYCHYCLHGFTKKTLLDKHIPYCQVHGAQRTEMPDEDNKWLKYTDVSKQLKSPYVVYADFECILERIYGCQPDPKTSSTIKLAKHVPSGFTYKVVGLTDDLTEDHVTYRGPNAAEVFVEHMIKLEERLINKLRNPKSMEMTDEDFENFRNATHCSICGGELGVEVARDHCHLTGKFRGAAHMSCNLNCRLRERIPVFFHNLRGYDSHLIMEAIGKTKKRINCIPQNHEKYISFSLGKMEFVDTFQFLSTSLEKLVNNLAGEGLSKFKHLRTYVEKSQPGNTNMKMKLLSRKGVYPYRYMCSFDRFREEDLPPKSAFYNDLDEQHISEEDYFHAQLVWDVLNVKDLGGYHNLYMESDVHLLADVFENFRNLCLDIYGLDPAHFYTSPGLAWQAALKMTGVNLELLTDPDMHLFVEKGLRGGISIITQRYAEANNKYLDDYDKAKESNHLIYLDANNLYGWAMSQPLPTHGFRWLTDEEIRTLDVTSIPENDKDGYIFSVDLHYPQHLHDLHNDYPLAPESFTITPDMLSSYQKELLNEMDMTATQCQKLVPNLYDKSDYVLHHRNLQLYLSLGMEVTKVHRVLSFKQSPWLQPYIAFNTDQRKLARNEFEKDFFKLMNNSVFGKTMENLRKRVNIELVNNERRLHKLTKKPGFKSFKIFNQDLASIELVKQKLVLNRPIYVGFAILDLSKVLMYDFHYKYIKEKYGNRACLLFSDTDSLCYSITTVDIYQDMVEDKDRFDFSGYPKGHPLYDVTNKKVIGKMKDETDSVPIRQFLGLRAKMYSMTYGDTEKRTAKGISKAVIKSKLRHELYRQCLFRRETQMESMNLFRTDKHQIHTVKLNKTTLSAFDDKRYIRNDGIHTLAHGHWRIKEQQ